MGQRLWVWWLSHSAASCSNRGTSRAYLAKYQKYPSGRLPGSCNHSAQSHPLSSTPTPTSTSTPSLLSTCLVAATATALHCCNCCCHPRCLSCASFFPFSGRLLSRPAFFGALLLNPKKDGFRESLSFSPHHLTCPTTTFHLLLLLHTSSSFDIRLSPFFRFPSNTRRTSTFSGMLTTILTVSFSLNLRAPPCGPTPISLFLFPFCYFFSPPPPVPP